MPPRKKPTLTPSPGAPPQPAEWTPPPPDPLREFKLATGPYASVKTSTRIQEAADALDRCGLPEIADWVRSLEEFVETEVEDRVAESAFSEEVLSDLSFALRLLTFLGKPKGKDKHPLFDAWAELCRATNKDVDLDKPDSSDLHELLGELSPDAFQTVVRLASENADFHESVRNGIAARDEGLIDLLTPEDVTSVLEKVFEDDAEYRAEVSRVIKHGAIFNGLREGDVGDIVRRALTSDEWRDEALGAIAEAFGEEPW